MKQLVCEMCGSTEMLKQDGVFVCQTCGCKYTVEEAKKMMFEGEVEVKGTVEVSNIGTINNYIEMSENALDAGNGESAFDYANKALELDPQNAAAWKSQMKSYKYFGTLGDLKLVDMTSAGNNVIKYSDNKEEAEREVYGYYLTRSRELMEISKSKLDDNADIKQTYNRMVLVSLLTAGSTVSQMDGGIVKIYENINSEAYSLTQLVPDEVLCRYPELPAKLKACAKAYKEQTKSVRNRYGIYGSDLSSEAIKARRTIVDGMNKRADEAKRKYVEIVKEEKKKQIEDYWNEHAGEKQQLEGELAGLIPQMEAYESQKKSLSEKQELESIDNEIKSLTDEMNSLGMFKGKEKKAINEKIQKLEQQKKDIEKVLNEKIDEIDSEAEPIKKRIGEIERSLGKPMTYGLYGDIEITSENEGICKKISIEVGEEVKYGDAVAWIDTGNPISVAGITITEIPICSEFDGVVASIEIKLEDKIEKNQVVATVNLK